MDEEGLRPHAPLGHLAHLGFALVGARDVDEVARHLLRDLAAFPGVNRVGLALTEGGGRRLRFTSSDRVDEAVDGDLGWCHIDAYDDVPLTHVVRTGAPVLGSRDELPSRYEDFVARQPADVSAVAAVPLPGVGSPIGGLVVYLDESWQLDDGQRRLLDATARRTADALRRVRAVEHQQHTPEDDASGGEAVTARIELAADPRSAGEARRFLRALLTDAGVDDEVTETALLCLSELVTNAVVHAHAPSLLTATLDRVLTVTLRDRGAGSGLDGAAPDTDALRVHGRGLQLVEALADRWGAERDAAGMTVWFVVGLEPEGSRAEDRTG